MHWIYAHFVGDYLIQSDWMAQNKKKSSVHCLVHVLTYMIPFLLCKLKPWQMIVIAIQHFLTDRTNFVVWFMKIKGSKKFVTGPLAPWSIVVVDNILHVLTIAFVIFLGKSKR